MDDVELADDVFIDNVVLDDDASQTKSNIISFNIVNTTIPRKDAQNEVVDRQDFSTVLDLQNIMVCFPKATYVSWLLNI